MSSLELADAAVTPALLLDELRAARVAADAAEVRVLEVAVEWAHAHPVLEGDESWRVRTASGFVLGEVDESVTSQDEVEWCGIPPVRWDAPAAFAAANRMSTAAGQALIRDALVLRHRLPRVWSRVVAGQVPAWRARRVAQAVLGSPADVVSFVDEQVAPVVDRVGTVTLDRLVDEAMMRLHAEQREADQVAALDARHVTLHEASINYTGVAELTVRGDWTDVHDFDQAVARVATALAEGGNTESLDVRRSLAVGVLADPAQAQALLTGAAAPSPTKQAVLYVHLSDLAVLGLEPVGRNETTGRPVFVQQIRDWLGRTDTHVVVKPVVDLADHVDVGAYEVPDRLREQVALTEVRCAFPWCTTGARRCDCDHVVPHARGGTTCSCNVAPLCRRHHRLKTHAGWRYTRIEAGVYLWSDPHDARYLRDRGGTSVVSNV